MEYSAYNEDMENVSTTSLGFEDMVKDNLVYVDKTEYIYKLVTNRNYRFFFVSRPRRFGKSLFCSTLHSLFEGKKEFFKGLYIEKETDYDFQPYPVIHFDFSGFDFNDDSASFLRAFCSAIWYEGNRNGVELEMKTPSEMLNDLIIRLSDEKGRIVILIDEFDSPFTSMGSPELADTMRKAFNPFYRVIKKHSARIRFFFITGVVKLANLSIFSAMNNLRDLSMDPHFSTAFGYTESEMQKYFGEGIDEWFEANRDKCNTKEQLLERIREYYDGYRFSPDSDVKVYNPVSIGYFFTSEYRFDNYWDQTGISSLAVDLAKRVNLVSIVDECVEIRRFAFTSFDIATLWSGRLRTEYVAALLYFAGYLTIGASDEDAISLVFPSREVSSSFSENLLLRYMNEEVDESSLVITLGRTFRRGDAEGFMKAVDSYFSAFSYDLIGGAKERFFHIAFHGIFVMLRLLSFSEDRGLYGRSDEIVLYGEDLWIFELKVNGSAEEAVNQIEEKKYTEKYDYLIKPGMDVHKIGVNFMTDERKLCWIIK